MNKRKDGLYREKLVINGKTKYFYGKKKADVLRKITEYKEKEKNGKTFEEVAVLWWEEAEPKLAYNTTKSYKPAKDRAIEYFKDKYIKDILPIDISQIIKQFSKTHAKKTVSTQLLIFNLIFKFAVAEGVMPFNPARDITIPQNLPKKKVNAPSKEDIQRVKNSVNCTFGLFAYMAMYTGLRRGELLALDWKDIDLKNRTITVNKSLYHVNNAPHVKLPKTKTSIGKVPIVDALLPYLKKGIGLVFHNDNGGCLTETQFQRKWELYQKESGVQATPHQFRHCYATMLIENGVPPEKAQALLRHAQLSTTMDVYREIRGDEIEKIFKEVYSVDIE